MRRVDLLLALAVLIAAGTVLDAWTPQASSRFLLTEALVDHGTVRLDAHAELVNVDYAAHDGHLYSDKAPYQPLLAIAPHAALRAVGVEPFPLVDGRADPEAGFHWARWWVQLWSATIPAAGLIVVLRRLAHSAVPETAARAAAALGFGTLLLPFAGLLFGHVLSALFVASAWLLVRRPVLSGRDALAVGLLLAAGVGTEFPVAIPAAILVACVLLSHGARRMATVVLAGGIGALPLLLYNTVAFGSPFETAYQGNLGSFEGEGALGVYNLVWPQSEELFKSMLGDRGLLLLTPVCTVALVAAARLALRPGPLRRDGILAFAVLIPMWLLSAGIDGYGGNSPGPRYLIPALPFLAVPLADAWRTARRACIAAAVFGTATMSLALAGGPLVDTEHRRSVRLWLDRIADGDILPSALDGPLGTSAFAVAALVAGVIVAALAIRADQRAAPQ